MATEEWKINVSGNAVEEFERIERAYDKIKASLQGIGSKGGSSLGLNMGSSQIMGGFAKATGGAYLAVKALGALKDGAVAVINKFGEFQQIKTILTNTFNSQFISDKVFENIQEFALRTPYDVKGVADAYTKLTNRGLRPTMSEMRNMGDLAAATGVEFESVALGLSNATVGQNKVLKRMGITAKLMGDKVIYTFKGVRTEVDRNATAIKDYILSLGKLSGVEGAMRSLEPTIVGTEGRLGDTWSQFKSNMGEALSPLYLAMLNTADNTLGMLNKMLEMTPAEVEAKSRGDLATFMTDYTRSYGESKKALAIKAGRDYAQPLSVVDPTIKASDVSGANVYELLKKTGKDGKSNQEKLNALFEINKQVGEKQGDLNRLRDEKNSAEAGMKGMSSDYVDKLAREYDVQRFTELIAGELTNINKVYKDGVEFINDNPLAINDYDTLKKQIVDVDTYINNEKDIKNKEKELAKLLKTPGYNELYNPPENPNNDENQNPAGAGTASRFGLAAPKTFNIFIEKIQGGENVTVATVMDFEQFMKDFQNRLLGTVSSISVQNI